MIINKTRHFIRRLARDQKGLTAVEYAVLGAVVVAAIGAVGQSFEGELTGAFSALFNQVGG
ncbi:MAG TPA: Flp family type IVb pilin [Sphingobium sp.]|nr:Flp family type IVb pilin [Sphingobium sp.]